MRSAFPLRPHTLSLALAVLLALPGRALADWGENWGTMLWSTTAPAVPALDGLGLALLLGALLAAAAWVLRRRRPALGFSVLLVALAIPLAVAAGTISIPNTFVNGTPANADLVNANFTAVENGVNGNAGDIATNASAIATQAATLASQGPHTVPGTGTNNTALGEGALQNNTSGAANTASGWNALHHNTTGQWNTATGLDALQHNTTGNWNTASGVGALNANTTGSYNTASGSAALLSNTTGSNNTASGLGALYSNTTGAHNTATGLEALSNNTSGNDNTASGYNALGQNTTGSHNTASGHLALNTNTTGNGNIALGNEAGKLLTTGHDNIMIGHQGVAGEAQTTRIGTAQTRAFIAGIRGKTTGTNNAIAVMIDSHGQLGTVSSSGRFKEDVAPMAEKSAALSALRPVTFRYKKAFEGGEKPIQFGLIAEEVAEVFPELVVFGEDGQPETVKYHLLSSLLLNELQKLADRHEALEKEHAALRAGMEQRLARLEAQGPVRVASFQAGAADRK